MCFWLGGILPYMTIYGCAAGQGINDNVQEIAIVAYSVSLTVP